MKNRKLAVMCSLLGLVMIGLAGCVGIEVGVEDVSSTEAEPEREICSNSGLNPPQCPRRSPTAMIFTASNSITRRPGPYPRVIMKLV